MASVGMQESFGISVGNRIISYGQIVGIRDRGVDLFEQYPSDLSITCSQERAELPYSASLLHATSRLWKDLFAESSAGIKDLSKLLKLPLKTGKEFGFSSLEQSPLWKRLYGIGCGGTSLCDSVRVVEYYERMRDSASAFSRQADRLFHGNGDLWSLFQSSVELISASCGDFWTSIDALLELGGIAHKWEALSQNLFIIGGLARAYIDFKKVIKLNRVVGANALALHKDIQVVLPLAQASEEPLQATEMILSPSMKKALWAQRRVQLWKTAQTLSLFVGVWVWKGSFSIGRLVFPVATSALPLLAGTGVLFAAVARRVDRCSWKVVVPTLALGAALPAALWSFAVVVAPTTLGYFAAVMSAISSVAASFETVYFVLPYCQQMAGPQFALLADYFSSVVRSKMEHWEQREREGCEGKEGFARAEIFCR